MLRRFKRTCAFLRAAFTRLDGKWTIEHSFKDGIEIHWFTFFYNNKSWALKIFKTPLGHHFAYLIENYAGLSLVVAPEISHRINLTHSRRDEYEFVEAEAMWWTLLFINKFYNY